MNDQKTKFGGLLSLLLALGFSGCFFHHHKSSSDNDTSYNETGDYQPQPQQPTASTGAHKMPRSHAGEIGEMLRNPERHLGQYVSSYGPVRTINVSPSGATEFVLSTPNYAYTFEVEFPGEIPNLEKNKDTYFLGTVRGVKNLGEVEALVVDGIAIQNTSGPGMNPYSWPKAVYVPGQEQAVSAWLNGELDLNSGNRNALPRPYAELAAAPAPAPNYYQPQAPQAPVYAPPAQAYAPAPAYAQPPAYRGGGGSIDSASLVKVVQNWNQLPAEAKERILGIVSEYSR